MWNHNLPGSSVLTLKVCLRSAKCMISLTVGALWILWCQPWITSVHPPNTSHPNPCLINIEGNSSSNNVLLTVHALLLRGGLAPCISASQTHTHAPQCDSVWKKKKKKHNSADQSCSARLLCTRGPWQKQWCLRCREPWVCPSLISKNSNSSWPAAADVRAWHKLIFTIRHKWTHTAAHENKDTRARMHETRAHANKCSAVRRSCCLICKTLLGKAGAKQAIRGSSSWALHCIPLTFTQWFMSEDLSPSQWGLHTQLFKTHNRGKGGEKT